MKKMFVCAMAAVFMLSLSVSVCFSSGMMEEKEEMIKGYEKSEMEEEMIEESEEEMVEEQEEMEKVSEEETTPMMKQWEKAVEGEKEFKEEGE